MPRASRTVNKKQLTENGPQKSQLSKRGFTLIEVVLSIFLVLAIASMLFSASGTYRHSRNSNLQSIASKIAAKEVENLRNTAFTSLPPSGSFSDPDLSKLPSGLAQRTIGNYQSSTKIKLITVTVSWTENSVGKNINMETLISESGI